jgi:hypothetical protein
VLLADALRTAATPSRPRPASRSASTTWSSRREADAARRRPEGSRRDRGAVPRGPHHRRRALQQGDRHLGRGGGADHQGDDEGISTDEVKDPDGTANEEGPVVQLDLHHGRLGRARLDAADASAGRHARSDGQAVGRDHRDPDHDQLPRRPHGAPVLHLDPRRPQGSGRHGAQDRELGLPDPPPGRRVAGRDHHRVRLRHLGRHEMSPLIEGGEIIEPWPSASSAAWRSRTWSTRYGEVLVRAGVEINEEHA